MKQKFCNAFRTAAVVAVLTLGMVACGDDEPAAVVTPPPPPPPFQPQAIEVELGRSGQSVTLMTTEAGGHALDGEAFASGGTRAVTVGGVEITYTLTLADGSWSADCACEVEVALGSSGRAVTLALNDADGTFSLDGEAVASGFRHMGYEFALEGGQWSASFVPVTQTVALGALGGTLELAQLEDGSWIAPDGTALPTGSTVAAGGNSYVLTLGADGTWTASYSPETAELLGTELTVSAREDGGYEVAGQALEFDTDGTDSITLDTGEHYLVTRNEDGTLRGARQEAGLDGATAASLGNLDDAKPALANDGTHLGFDLAGDSDPRFSFTDLFADGTDAAQGDGFVAGVIGDIREIRASAALLIEALDGDGEAGDLEGLLGRDGLWGQIDTALDRVFGPDDPDLDTDDDLGGAPDADDFLEEVDEILAALSSAEALAAADDGDGVFEREFGGDYEARNWEATAWLGSTGSARFGVVEHVSRDHANEGGASDPARGSFRYSPASGTGALRRVTDRLELSGDALYDGETLAIDGEGTVYSGDIAVQVRLGARQVNGTIENLAAEDGGLWEPSFAIAGRGVRSIILPTASLRRDAGWAHVGSGSIAVSTRAGLNRRVPADFSFRGELLGRGDTAAGEVVGDWGSIVPAGSDSTADWIAGAFGAILNDVDDVSLPSVADRGGQVDTILTNWEEGITVKDGELNLGELERAVPGASPAGWTLGLAAAYESQGSRQEDDAERWVDLARAELEGLRDRLLTLHRAGGRDDPADTTLVEAEARLWNDAMDEVSRLLFGTDDRGTSEDAADDGPYTGDQVSERFPDTSSDAADTRKYPSFAGATARSDGRALDIIDALLEALASRDSYRDAYEAGGIFANVYSDTDGDGMPDESSISRDPDGGDDFNRVQSRVTSLAGATTLTRFGLFWGWETDRAVDGGSRGALGGSDADASFLGEHFSDTGLYAYSEIGRVRYTSELDPTLPRGGSATYVGDAVASYNRVLYTGTSEVFVTWKAPRGIAPRTVGRLSATFALERLDNGDRLVRESDGVDIDDIVFSNSLLEWQADGTIRSIRDGIVSLQSARDGLRVDFWNRTDARHATGPLLYDDGTDPQDERDMRQVLDATFVGRTVDAPAGVIGYFKVQNPDPDTGGMFRFTNLAMDDRAMDASGSANTEALVGAFGADLDPASILPPSGGPGDGSGPPAPPEPPMAETVFSNHPEIVAADGRLSVPPALVGIWDQATTPPGFGVLADSSESDMTHFGVFWRSGLAPAAIHPDLEPYDRVGLHAYSLLPDTTAWALDQFAASRTSWPGLGEATYSGRIVARGTRLGPATQPTDSDDRIATYSGIVRVSITEGTPEFPVPPIWVLFKMDRGEGRSPAVNDDVELEMLFLPPSILGPVFRSEDRSVVLNPASQYSGQADGSGPGGTVGLRFADFEVAMRFVGTVPDADLAPGSASGTPAGVIGYFRGFQTSSPGSGVRWVGSFGAEYDPDPPAYFGNR